MTGLPLFDNAEHLKRVKSRITHAVMYFLACRARSANRTFHASDLMAYVVSVVGPISPESACRIMRDLKKRGSVRYQCVDKCKSLYEAMA